MPGIHLIGLSEANLERLAISAGVLLAIWLLRRVVRVGIKLVLPGESKRAIVTRFWGHQIINTASFAFGVFALASLWFEDPARLATALGLVGAGLAFALQRVITAFAGYVVILNSGLFAIGDRINMGGVRGDVLRLGFMQTTLMEMGVAPGSDAGPAVWVKSRQFTGRIVTVSNAKIFEDPVYNYTRDFPFIWEEMSIPITYAADRARAEAILLQAAKLHATEADQMAAEKKRELQERFGVEPIELAAKVYYRITDNWLELTVRFVIGTHRIRGAKDAMSRYIVVELEKAGIGIASATYDIVGFPAVEIRQPRTADPIPAASGAPA